MNSPPEALSPSPSTPSSGSPLPDDIGLPTPTAATDGGATQAQIAAALSSPNQSQSKRRLPTSSSSGTAAREGREIKTRRREHDDRQGGSGRPNWESIRSEGGPGQPPRTREELIDTALVDYVRKSTS